MFDERTNLYRAVAQTLEWVHGLTSIEYEVNLARIAEVSHADETHYSFDITTNQALLSGIRHPMGLVAKSVHVALSGVIETPKTLESLEFDKQIAQIEIEDMVSMFLHADNGGYSTVSVQTKIGLFTGGEEVLSRHFLYRNNMLHLIR